MAKRHTQRFDWWIEDEQFCWAFYSPDDRKKHRKSKLEKWERGSHGRQNLALLEDTHKFNYVGLPAPIEILLRSIPGQWGNALVNSEKQRTKKQVLSPG